jgi:hypothetical protein
MRIGLGRAPKPHVLADVVSAAFAVLAVLARQADLERDPVARLEVDDFLTNSDNGAAGLVAQRQRLAHKKVAIAKVVEVVHVRAAEAGGLDSDLNFVFFRSWEAAFFL